jgi:putative transposase
MRRSIPLIIGPNKHLINTIKKVNKAVNDILELGFTNKTYNKLKLHHMTYYKIREKYKLPASLVTTARDQASEMLKREKCRRLPVKKSYSAIRYNNRTFSFNPKKNIISLSSLQGRIKFSVTIPKYFKKYLSWNFKSALLSYNKNKLVIRLIAEAETPPIIYKGGEVLGVDTGVFNHAVLSNNLFYKSSNIRHIKAKYKYLRSVLQAKGTRSAKRKLKKISGKEKRFIADVNHCVSKWIVSQPYNAIALEKLSIKRQKKLGRKLNQCLDRWSFGQLQYFIEYKAESLGKLIIKIDPRYTSQKCSRCENIHNRNRKRHEYKCRKCGIRLHSDLNASRNISNLGKAEVGRLFVNQPNVTSSVVKNFDNTLVASS